MVDTMWLTIIQQCADMKEFVQSTPLITPWKIHDFIVEIIKIRNKNIVKFLSRDTSIYNIIHEVFNCVVYVGSNIALSMRVAE